MFRVIVFIALISAVFGLRSSVNNVRSVTSLNAKSKALPFLEAPSKLDGSMIGDNGFDPLGFSDLIPLTYARSAELKHGRVAMLAAFGFIFQQYVHILTPEADPIKAVSALGLGPNLQILSFIGTIELATWKKTYGTGEPGNYNFDPMGQSKGKSKAQMDDLKLKEIKNGRLAMIAIMGMIIQQHIFGTPTL